MVLRHQPKTFGKKTMEVLKLRTYGVTGFDLRGFSRKGHFERGVDHGPMRVVGQSRGEKKMQKGS